MDKQEERRVRNVVSYFTDHQGHFFLFVAAYLMIVMVMTMMLLGGTMALAGI